MVATVVNIKVDSCDIYIGRSPHKKFHYGNPFTHIPFKHFAGNLASVEVNNRDESINCFRQWIEGSKWQDIEPERRLWILEN